MKFLRFNQSCAVLALLFLAGAAALLPAAQNPAPAHPWSAPALSAIRRAAAPPPAQPPPRINTLKSAETHRGKDATVKAPPAEPSVQARTVFQIVYPGGATVMVDSGMDETIHKLIGRGEIEPYFADK